MLAGSLGNEAISLRTCQLRFFITLVPSKGIALLLVTVSGKCASEPPIAVR